MKVKEWFSKWEFELLLFFCILMLVTIVLVGILFGKNMLNLFGDCYNCTNI